MKSKYVDRKRRYKVLLCQTQEEIAKLRARSNSCLDCGWKYNVRKMDVQVVPTDEDFKNMGLEGCSYSYVPLLGKVEVYWCPNCREIKYYYFNYDLNNCLYDDETGGYN